MSYQRIEQPLSELHKTLDILSAEEGYKFAGLHTARMAASRAFIMVKLKATDGKCFEFTFTAERVNRKFDIIQRLAKQQEAIMAIDYKARALKSAATRKAKQAAKSGNSDIEGQTKLPDVEAAEEEIPTNQYNTEKDQVEKVKPKTKRARYAFDENGKNTSAEESDKDAGITPPAGSTQKKKAKAPKSKSAVSAKADKPCQCGCGALVKGNFAIGHDAKLHSAVSKAAKAETKLPKALAKLAGAYIAKRWPDEAKLVL